MQRLGTVFLVTGGVLLGFGAIGVLYAALARDESGPLGIILFTSAAPTGMLSTVLGAALRLYHRRRIVVYSLLVFFVPNIVQKLIGFFYGFSLLVLQQPFGPPSWIVTARTVSWWGLVFLFAYLVVVQRDRTFAHVGGVTLLAWLLSHLYSFVSVSVLYYLGSIPDTVQFGLFAGTLKGLTMSVVRALVGSGLGMTFLWLRQRSAKEAV